MVSLFANIRNHDIALQEDVVVMQRINGHMILSCGCVVSPLGWSASHKVGLDLKGIHDPVPHFNNGPALKFVSKILEKGLKAETPLARANWFIVDTDEHSLVCSVCMVLLLLQMLPDIITDISALSISPTGKLRPASHISSLGSAFKLDSTHTAAMPGHRHMFKDWPSLQN